jgi:membrane peptidoglycan carboxypeptidase
MTRDKPFSLLALSVWRKHLWPLLRRPWLGLPLCLVLVLVLADRLLPLPLPSDDLARVVLAEDGTPLWHFADHDGVWRYPVSPDQVSPYYLEALLTYEDRWFYRHPGVNAAGVGPRRLAEPQRRSRAVWRQHLVDAGGAPARSARTQFPRQAQAAVAHAATGMAPVRG